MNSLSILAVGDISLNGIYRSNRYINSVPWRNLLAFKGTHDLRIGNLESPITSADRVDKSKLTLKANQNAKAILAKSHFNLLSMANNHAMDFGPDGLYETTSAIELLGISHVGAGEKLVRANAPIFLEIETQRVVFVSFCDVIQISPLYASANQAGVAPLNDDSVAIVRSLKGQADWIIVQLHWGTEMCQLPSREQRDLAHRFVEAGASAIIGHHPHVIQPLEIIDNAPVWYSLGNFAFSDEFWSGVNERDEPFIAEHRLHPLARNAGIAEFTLQKSGPPQCKLTSTRICSNGMIVEKENRQTQLLWQNLCDILSQPGYEKAWNREVADSEVRRAWQNQWQSPFRRLRMKAFQFGLISQKY